jgi:osmotically inducible lipoprotein OsmB
MEHLIMKKTILTLITLSLLPLSVTACGTTKQERGLSGAGIGAGAGAAAGALTGGSILGGAVLGGVVGGATGVLTDKDDINLD